MNAPLYTTEILRLAASLPEPRHLDRVEGRCEKRSPACGSTIWTAVQLDDDGRVQAVSQEVHACAFGQASASLLAAGANGRTLEDVSDALKALEAWLSGVRDDAGSWPGLSALAPARARKSRHGAILLPFKALAAAMKSAGA